MYQPQFGDIKPSMFICGNSEGAKQTVAYILTAFGWETEYVGTATSVRAIETLGVFLVPSDFLKNQ